jgi:hypothetical protein
MEADMKHQSLEQLKTIAEVNPEDLRPALTRRERLQRWAELLDRQRDRRLATLHGTEYQPPEKRALMRSADSPITIAFSDPVLRADGLKDDTYGEAKRYFELSDWQLHEIVCYCHLGETMSAASAAKRVKSAMNAGQGGIFARLREAISG